MKWLSSEAEEGQTLRHSLEPCFANADRPARVHTTKADAQRGSNNKVKHGEQEAILLTRFVSR